MRTLVVKSRKTTVTRRRAEEKFQEELKPTWQRYVYMWIAFNRIQQIHS